MPWIVKASAVDHASCSRVHAALIWHKHLERSFLVDLGSTHGTYIGNFRIEAHKPTQLPVDSTFRFGESTRRYIMRERPKSLHSRPIMDELEKSGTEADGSMLGLPETENELDNLTEFNTAQNRRIPMMGISKDENFPKKRRKIKITFNEEEEVINPEDIDPSVGRFRNMVTTTIIPIRPRQAQDMGLGLSTEEFHPKRHVVSPGGRDRAGLYDDIEASTFSTTLSSSLGLPLPNPAPDVDLGIKAPVEVLPLPGEKRPRGPEPENPDEPKKKKYAKEAWPGRKHGPAQGLF